MRRVGDTLCKELEDTDQGPDEIHMAVAGSHCSLEHWDPVADRCQIPSELEGPWAELWEPGCGVLLDLWRCQNAGEAGSEEGGPALGHPTAAEDHLAVAEEGMVVRTCAGEEFHRAAAVGVAAEERREVAGDRDAAHSWGGSSAERGRVGRDGAGVAVVPGQATAVGAEDNPLGPAEGAELMGTVGVEEHMAELGAEEAVGGSRMVLERCNRVYLLTDGCDLLDHLCHHVHRGHHHFHSGTVDIEHSRWQRAQEEVREGEGRSCTTYRFVRSYCQVLMGVRNRPPGTDLEMVTVSRWILSLSTQHRFS